MKSTVLILTPLILLAGCGKGDVNLKNASVDDVVKATTNAQALTPGEWSTSTQITAVDMPGAPEKAKVMLAAISKAMVGKKTASENCVTPEQAKKPDANMFAGANSGSCTFEKFSMAGGRMDAVMNCAQPGSPGKMKMTMNGPYGGDSYSLASQIQMSGGPGMAGAAGMTISATNTGKRIGACKAS
jgi:Protein of unknown function (DUF3617)